jgi:hypothetical protein
MINVILFHDGCGICQGISATMTSAFASPAHQFESVNLTAQKDRIEQARLLGIERLPSLVINGQVLRLQDHSAIDHCA